MATSWSDPGEEEKKKEEDQKGSIEAIRMRATGPSGPKVGGELTKADIDAIKVPTLVIVATSGWEWDEQASGVTNEEGLPKRARSRTRAKRPSKNTTTLTLTFATLTLAFAALANSLASQRLRDMGVTVKEARDAYVMNNRNEAFATEELMERKHQYDKREKRREKKRLKKVGLARVQGGQGLQIVTGMRLVDTTGLMLPFLRTCAPLYSAPPNAPPSSLLRRPSARRTSASATCRSRKRRTR